MRISYIKPDYMCLRCGHPIPGQVIPGHPGYMPGTFSITCTKCGLNWLPDNFVFKYYDAVNPAKYREWEIVPTGCLFIAGDVLL
jgi:DNA-directed RNA polymerase subunit RPC12/RpoP